ncbi:Maltose O-acetyltransferase [Porphyridium purpureum]|uniref:Maltose O-acetyltransferase n=1 Tax=Porphyridium purpureum TaxID=35688 RepID=A0A5J4YYM9_PORPP|nr:Maltose O-acetyltransferase [Porphyridium purpureum]|eukprot:POR4768..scf209_3
MEEDSMKAKMLRGELYIATDPELAAERMRCREILWELNSVAPKHAQQQIPTLVSRLFANVGKNVWVEPPFRCDYGKNITVGDNFYCNFDCCFLDVCQINVGSNVLLGPAVQVYTASHPLSASLRREGYEDGSPITIGNDVWIGGGAILLPGVSIGSNVVIGAGSVVTKSIPDNVIAAGNPCKVLRPNASHREPPRQET